MHQLSLFTPLEYVAGVDEAGRGALVGDVVAAAVILPATFDLPRLTDSKKLSAAQREKLFVAICQQARAFAVGCASPAEIDALNIHHATLLAMQRAVNGLALTPTRVLVDGKFSPALAMPCQAIVGGDGLEACISAASIVAKVSRDHALQALDRCYPEYGFAQHKGYGTARHLAALAKFGALPVHRQSFAPVRAVQMRAAEDNSHL